jgi:Holliday junction resolvase RusA-like endonuclease
MTYIEFTVDGEPVGKGRPRFTRNGHAYTPEKTADYEQLVKLSFRKKYPDFKPILKVVPLSVVICAEFPIPASFCRNARLEAKRGTRKPTKKPDADNIAKSICDALNGLAYHDDSQIVELYVFKSYSENPKVTVTIAEL